MLMHLKGFDADVVDIPRAELPIQFLYSQLFQVLQQVGDVKVVEKSRKPTSMRNFHSFKTLFLVKPVLPSTTTVRQPSSWASMAVLGAFS